MRLAMLQRTVAPRFFNVLCLLRSLHPNSLRAISRPRAVHTVVAVVSCGSAPLPIEPACIVPAAESFRSASRLPNRPRAIAEVNSDGEPLPGATQGATQGTNDTPGDAHDCANHQVSGHKNSNPESKQKSKFGHAVVCTSVLRLGAARAVALTS